jgi:hypothetical protein
MANALSLPASSAMRLVIPIENNPTTITAIEMNIAPATRPFCLFCIGGTDRKQSSAKGHILKACFTYTKSLKLLLLTLLEASLARIFRKKPPPVFRKGYSPTQESGAHPDSNVSGMRSSVPRAEETHVRFLNATFEQAMQEGSSGSAASAGHGTIKCCSAFISGDSQKP